MAKLASKYEKQTMTTELKVCYLTHSSLFYNLS